MKDAIVSQLIQQKAKQTLKDLHDAAKIDVRSIPRSRSRCRMPPSAARRRRRTSLSLPKASKTINRGNRLTKVASLDGQDLAIRAERAAAPSGH